MVAGLSSRFGGKPKWLIKIGPNQETLIEYSLKQALKAGINKIIFIVSEKTHPLFKQEFGDNYNNIPIIYVFQKFDPEKRDKPWGTVDALCSIREIIDCPFIVCNGDDIYGENAFKILVNHLKNDIGGATIGYKLKNVLSEKGVVNRGIFQIEDNFVKSIKEIFNLSYENLVENKLSGEELCSMNIFAFHQSIIPELNKVLEKFKRDNKDNKKIECLLPKEITNLIGDKRIILKICPTEEKWLGVTNPEDEEKVREELKIK